MVHQLRIYEIFVHKKAALHASFRDHAVRLLRATGYGLPAWSGPV